MIGTGPAGSPPDDPSTPRRPRWHGGPWTPGDQLSLARAEAAEADARAEDEQVAEIWRKIRAANPHPGPGGWRLQ